MKKKIVVAGVLIIAFVGLIAGLNISSVAEYNKESEVKTQLNNKDSKKEADKKAEDKKKEAKEKKEAEKKEASSKTKDGKTSTKTTSKKKSSSKTSTKATAKTTSSSSTIKVTIYIDVTNLNTKSGKNKLKPELRRFVPSSGYILGKTVVEVPRNSTVFDVLKKVTRQYRIQMEYEGASSNAYNSVYIEGINNIYEFSAGSESGWEYSVNGVFPNYGVSAYTVKNRDTIRMAYTTNLGCDLGVSIKSCK